MKTLGIIVEYNPFHFGHARHLANAKKICKCDRVVAVMSGNFVQRGEPAICDKWRRTKMALEAGVDLVIELPLYYATGSAGYFAKGAVGLLKKSGIIDCMCFGSEWADIEAITNCAKAVSYEDEAFKVRLQANLRLGMSYPSARAKASETILPETANNVLGVEYIKSLMELNSKIVPYTVPRSPISAKDIRAVLKDYDFNLSDLDNLSSIFHYILRTHEDLSDFVDVSEDLANRLKQLSRGNIPISKIIVVAKTKNYTYLRLQRAVLHMILGITKSNLSEYESAGGAQYIRVLGFHKSQAELLKLLKTHATLPIVTNLKNASLGGTAAKMLKEELRSTGVYSLAFSHNTYFNEHQMPMCIV